VWQATAAAWEFAFPHAVGPKLHPSSERWTDARDVLARYFDGAAPRPRVSSAASSRSTSPRTRRVRPSIDAAQCVHARISRASAREIRRTRLPDLQDIPETTDALATAAQDAVVVAMVVRLAAIRGIGVAKATKLLCQKRPALVPMLDSVACPVLGVPDFDAPGEKVRRAYARFRELAAHSGNAATLTNLRGWFDARPPIVAPTGCVSFARVSLLRAVDVLAWLKGMERGADGS